MSTMIDSEVTMRDAYDPASFGRAIRAIRHERAWTQAKLAEWLGVSRQTVVALEQGGPVSLIVALKAVSVLGSRIVVAPKGAVLSEVESS